MGILLAVLLIAVAVAVAVGAAFRYKESIKGILIGGRRNNAQGGVRCQESDSHNLSHQTNLIN